MSTRIVLQDSDYRGRVYRGFTARRGHNDGPGWHVYGACLPDVGEHTYGGGVIMHCAWPDKPARYWPGWNVRRNAGWRTKREAQAVADRLNAIARRDGAVMLPPCALRRVLDI